MSSNHSHDHDHSSHAHDDVIVGIDLGTTNSLVALVRDGQPEILKSREGERLVPSVVSFVDQSPVIGYAARKRKITDAAHTIFSVKRLLGRGTQDLQEMQGDLPYQVVGESGVAQVRVGERAYTAIEISAMILRELKKAAEEALGHPVSKTVITVPAYFNDSQRQATRAAGRLAGWDVMRIVNEPTAASLAYGLQTKREGIIAVYDLGGGTFDLSILKLHNGIFEVLSTHGDTALGGDDLDRAIASRMREEYREKFGEDPYADLEIKADFLFTAERVKQELSTQSRATFSVKVKSGPETNEIRRDWTVEEFEAHARPILERTRKACEWAIRDAGIAKEEITDVVMVGGPTRLRIVQEVAEQIFGKKPNTSVHPDEVVALGAAIQADILAGKNTEALLLDVVPLSLGLETYGGLMETLIPRNTKIPTSAKEMFTTFVDNQTAVDVHVLQGEQERASENRSLARFKLKGLEPSPAGFPRVEVNFLIDADGILQVSAKNLRTGHEQIVEVRPSFGLTDDEVLQMLERANAEKGEDLEFKRWIEVQTQAEPVLRAAEKKLPDARRLLSVEEAAKIEDLCRAMNAAIEAKDPERTQNLKYELNAATVRLAELVLKETLSKGTSRGPATKQ